MAHRQGSPNRQGKRSCCTLPTPCLARARSLFLRTLLVPHTAHNVVPSAHPLCFASWGNGAYIWRPQYLCVYVYVCVLIPEFLSSPTVITTRFDNGLEKANSCKFLQVLWKEAERRFYNYPCRRWGWHMWSQREGRIPANSSTMGKVSAETHNHWTQIFRRVGMFNPSAQKTTRLARQAL